MSSVGENEKLKATVELLVAMNDEKDIKLEEIQSTLKFIYNNPSILKADNAEPKPSDIEKNCYDEEYQKNMMALEYKALQDGSGSAGNSEHSLSKDDKMMSNNKYYSISEAQFGLLDSREVALWFHSQGLNLYVGKGKQWIDSGQKILNATVRDLVKELGINNSYHRKKLHLALSSLKCNSNIPRINLDHIWVSKWLDDIGLSQYKECFIDALIDGRMLHYLTVEELIGLKITNTLHHQSFRWAIWLLRENNFKTNFLKCRPSHKESVLHNCPQEVIYWSNHRVMDWLRSIDLCEYAPNLRGSGVHGSLMVNEPNFNVEVLALILAIPSYKSLLRRHLSTHFARLLGSSLVRKKRLVCQTSSPHLTTNVKVKKDSFKKDDGLRFRYVCPMD